MIQNRQLLFICVAILVVTSSCQKKYERPDVVIATGAGASTGGTTGGTGSLLIKAESKTAGNTTEASVTTYDYDASNRLIKITNTVTDSANQTKNIVYRYNRDANGKIVQIISNVFSAAQPGAGFPDSIYVAVHYPAGSSNYDYTRFSFTLSGFAYMDSVAYVYNAGIVTSRNEYSGFSVAGALTLSQRTTFEYTNLNLTMMKFYDPSSTTVPSVTAVIGYDSKTAALITGNEAFLIGQNEGFVSKNNPIKETWTDNTQGTVALLANYTLQYNANNYPITGTLVESVPAAKTQNLKFTYK